MRLTPGEVREIYDLRTVLECDCLRRAAQVMRPEHLRELDRIRVESDQSSRGGDWAARDWEFHRAIYQLANRQRQLRMIEGLRHLCFSFVAAYSSLPAKKGRWLSEHRLMLRHLEQGEPEQAVIVLGAHLEAAAQHVLEQMTSTLKPA